MKLYKITADVAKEAGQEPIIQWAGSQSECAKIRKELVSDQGFKRADITTDEVEVDTKKEGLIAFLNGLGS